MKIVGYLTLDPLGDRPYFSSSVPAVAILKAARPDVRVFDFVLEVPDLAPLDGQAQASPAREL